MRSINFAALVCLVGVLGPACSQSQTCKPETVLAYISCPAGFTAGTFEVSVSRDEGAFTRLNPDLRAVCPITTVELQLSEYKTVKQVRLEVVAVDTDGNRWPASNARAELASSCTVISADVFGSGDAGSPENPDGDTTSSLGDGGDDSCEVNGKRCFEGASQTCTDSKWVTIETCPNLCRDGLCTGQCKPETKTCQSRTPLTCTADGTPLAGEPCPSLCKDGACVGDCQPRARRCTDNTPELCDETGSWKPEPACSAGCMDGFCSGCAKGDTMCNADTPFTCNDAGKWIKGAQCPFFCNAATRKCDGECTPSMVRCGGGEKIETCDAAGLWKPAAEACKFVCVAGGSCGGECRPGAAVCAAGNTARTCDTKGVWSPGTKCEFVCKDGSCAGACTPNDTRCNPSGGSSQTCTADGTWADTMTCASGCLGKICSECAPSTSRCAGTNAADAQLCGSDGKWGPAMTCATGCSAGACNECTGGTRCTNDGNLQTCTNGAWASPTPCGSKGCLGGKCNVCKPDAKRCAGGIAYTCKTDGLGETEMPCGAPGCSATTPECNKCKPSEKRCSADKKTAFECNADGTVDVSTSCGSQECNPDPARKVCNVCTPNEKTCSGTSRRTCAADGSRLESFDCGVPGCSGSECNLCGKDNRRCSSGTAPYGNLETCSADQKSWMPLQTCPQPAGCNPNTLQCNSCVADAPPRCSSVSQTAKCRSDGSGEDFSNCVSGKYCSSGVCTACAAPPAGCTVQGSRVCSQASAAVITCGYDANNCLVQTAEMACPGPAGGNGSGECTGAGNCTTKCNGGFTKCGDGVCRAECAGITWFDTSLGCPQAISDDGQVVLFPSSRRWQRSTGQTSTLSLPPGMVDMYVTLLSGDGSGVGTASDAAKSGLYRWPVSGNPVLIKMSHGFTPYAASKTADYILGLVDNSAGDIVRLGPSRTDEVAFYSFPRDISPTGDFAVGRDVLSKKAFYWSPDGVASLIDLPNSYAAATTDTGRSFLGYDDTKKVFLFTNNGGNTMTYYPSLVPSCDYLRPTEHTIDVSGDGAKILGVISPSNTECDAGIFISPGGAKKVAAILAANGVSLQSGYRLDVGSAISRNGQVVIGCGTLNGNTQNPLGYRVVLP